MNPLFSRMLKRYTKPMNADVMNGLAVEKLKYIEEHLDSQFRSICQGLPDCLVYEGLARCSPQEEYEEVTRPKNNRRNFDLAKNSFYMVKLFFTFTDKLGKKTPITQYMYLPYTEEAGIISIYGSEFHLIPVLSDKVFTPSENSIFVRLTQDKNIMMRAYNTILVDDKRLTKNVAWATIYRSPDAKRSEKGPKTLLVHYLFAKYGFEGVFLRYGGNLPVVGLGDDITKEKYPPSDWVICKSTQRAPESCFEKFYRPTNVRLSIRREDWNKQMETLVYGFFYVVDHFPDRFEPRTQETIDEDGVVVKNDESTPEQRHAQLRRYLNDLALWKILIGVIVQDASRSESALYRDMTEHFESLDAYLDAEAKKKLAEKSIFIENYYDLLNYISVNFNQMIQEGNEAGLNVYGKNLEILSYVLYDVFYNLTRMKFQINKTAKRRPLTIKDITSNFQRYLPPTRVFSIRSGKIITKAVSYSGDHKYPGITSVIVEQESRAGGERGKNSRTVVGRQHHLDLSMVTVGSVLNLPKANPTPLARVNMYVTLDKETGTVLPNPDYNWLIEQNKQYFKS